jgi:hypothetical protein
LSYKKLILWEYKIYILDNENHRFIPFPFAKLANYFDIAKKILKIIRNPKKIQSKKITARPLLPSKNKTD